MSKRSGGTKQRPSYWRKRLEELTGHDYDRERREREQESNGGGSKYAQRVKQRRKLAPTHERS